MKDTSAMGKQILKFPYGFMWGTATSSHQVEGGNSNNNWALWETQEGRIFNGDRAGDACQWWQGRWREDFERAADGGQNAHRLSIEWSRVQPATDRWDEDALNHYRRMLSWLVKRGMTPLVTLHHFTEPLWVYEQGGWESESIVALFEAYVRRVVHALKDFATLWIPINEPNVYVLGGYLDGVFPPGKHNNQASFNVMVNMLKAHSTAYHAIHEIQPEARVGTSINMRDLQPANPESPFDRWIARLLWQNFNASFTDTLTDGTLRFLFKRSRMPQAMGTQDFVGVNYYTGDRVAFAPLVFKEFFNRRKFPEGAEVSETGFLANVPAGFFNVLNWAKGYNLPIIITENGIEDSQDTLRPQYLAEHLHQLWRALDNRAQIKGYFHWSLVDNFEWERGWSQRFGLWGLERETQTRIRRKSVDLYADVCRTNVLTREMVPKYSPQSLNKIFNREETS